MKKHSLTMGKTVFICSLILLFFAIEVFGATYYVAPTGSDSNRGTYSAPFRNIQKAADSVSPGDTVIVKNGKYYDHNSNNWVLRINRGGAAGKIITFRAENVHGAIIDGENQTTGSGILVNAPYIRIEGFEIRNFEWFGAQVGTDAYQVVFSQNKIHHIGYVNDESLYGHAGVYSSATSYSVTFDRNIIYDIGRNDIGCEHCYRHDHGLYLRGKWFTITNNVFYNFHAGWAISLRGYQGSSAGATPNHIVSNNTFGDGINGNVVGVLNIYNSSPDSAPENIYIQNNLFGTSNGGAVVRISGSVGNVYFYNNVSAEPNMYSLKSGKTARIYESDNSLGHSTRDYYVQNWSNKDFRPTINSSLIIDKGRSKNAPDHDFLNTSRPKGYRYDIGSYEYADSDQSAEGPVPPQGLRVLQQQL